MLKEKLHAIVEDLEAELKELSDYIYDHPELGYEEFKSSQAHADLLVKHGFEMEKPYLDCETAFRAVYDSGKPGPTVAYLAEYDALPGIGHGCGHNMLGSTQTGAGIALSKILDEIGGRIIVFGTPAEETSGFKVDLVEADAFSDVDVALFTHPSSHNYKSGESMAIRCLAFEFHGKPAHAASHPQDGINALDAAIGMFNHVNALREHMEPSARVHGIIRDGGEAANVVPEFARTEFYIRTLDKPYLEELTEKVINCAKAGALATGCELEYFDFEKSYDNLITNEELSEAYNRNAAALGIEMIEEEEKSNGSNDMGNVSQVVPAIHSYFAITDGRDIGAHTEEFRDCTITDFAYEAMYRTVKILAGTGYDVITDEKLLQNIKAEFKARVTR